MSLPRVIIANAVSLDGRIDWFAADVGRFYALIGRFGEDATLAGSETILAALAMSSAESEPALEPSQGDEGGALLAVVDSRGRVRDWQAIKRWPMWRRFVAVCSRLTPQEHLRALQAAGIDVIVAGEERADLAAALQQLGQRFGATVVRVESGGTLNGVLLRQGLVDEVGLLLHPALVGGRSAASMFRAPDLNSPDGVIGLRLREVERLDGGLVWLRYDVDRVAAAGDTGRPPSR